MLALLALLAVLAYAPLLGIPLFEDDFPNLMQAQQYGAPSDALILLHKPVFRLRATSFWAMFLLWKVGKLAPAVYHLTSLALHILNSWLVYVCLPGVAADSVRRHFGRRAFSPSRKATRKP